MNSSASSAFHEPLFSHDFLAQELGADQSGAVEGGEVREQGSDNGAHDGLFQEDKDEKDDSNAKDWDMKRTMILAKSIFPGVEARGILHLIAPQKAQLP